MGPAPGDLVPLFKRDTLTELEDAVLIAVNEERGRMGLAPLQLMPALVDIARQHTLDMATSGVMGHKGLDQREVADRATSCGLAWERVAENVARNRGYSDAAGKAVFDWMSSAGHRANIVDSSFTHTGIGVVKAKDDYYYFTQVFILLTKK